MSDPIGIRIQVPRMRIWCPRPLDDGAMSPAYFTTFPDIEGSILSQIEVLTGVL